jgi:hypothetical protein
MQATTVMPATSKEDGNIMHEHPTTAGMQATAGMKATTIPKQY